MIRNYFYLIVGLLCILFAVTHTLNGVETSLSSLDNAQIENNTKVAFTYVWHIIGIENLVFGIALLIMTFRKNLIKSKVYCLANNCGFNNALDCNYILYGIE